MPGNPDRAQESVPRKQFVRIRSQRYRAGIVGEHVVQKLGHRRHLDAMLVEKPERQQPIPGRLHPTDPGNIQRRNIPDRRAVLCHPYLRRPSWLTARDDSTFTPRRAVTFDDAPSPDWLYRHHLLTSEKAQDIPS